MANYRRGYSWEEIQMLPAPTGGWNPDAPISELPDNQAPLLDNAIFRPGKVGVRGQIAITADFGTLMGLGATPAGVIGYQPVPGKPNLVLARKTSGGTPAAGAVDPWFAPLIKPASAALATGITTIWTSTGGVAGSSNVVTANKIPGPRGITFEGQRYYLGYDTASAAVQDAASSYFVKPNSLNVLPSGGAGSITELTLAPHGAIDVKAYQSRLWLAGGVDTPGAAATFSPTTVFFTVPGAFNLGAASADWRDPVNLTTNQIKLDGNTDDPIIGFAQARNTLLVFRYNSVYAIRGTTTANYAAVPISRDVGAYDARSIVESDQGVYFIGTHGGLWFTDGAAVRNVSGSAQQTLINASGIVLGSIRAGWGGYATMSSTSDNQLLLSLGIPNIVAGALDNSIVPVWSAMVNPSTGQWTRITSKLWTNDTNQVAPGNIYPGYVIRMPDRRLLALGNKFVSQFESEGTTAGLNQASGLASSVTNDATVGVTAWTNPANATVADGSVATVSPAITLTALTPGAGADSAAVGTLAWSNTGNVTALDGAYAQSAVGVGTTHYLKSSAFAPPVPANAVILGIQATSWHSQDTTTNAVENSIRLTKAGTPTGTDKSTGAAWGGPGAAVAKTWGSATDLWGTTWTAADINDPGFGLAESAAQPGGRAVYVDSAVIKVWYTLPTQYLKAVGYGLAVPTSATVVGIQVAVRRADTSSSAAAIDASVRLYKAGVLTGTDKASVTAWPSALTSATYGAAADLWGAAWTPSDVNNANFGIAVAATVGPTTTAPQWAVDSITVSVYYTVTTSGQTQSFVQTSALYDVDLTPTYYSIPFKWRTKLLPAGTNSRKFAQMKRYLFDFIFMEAAPQQANAFTIKAMNESLTTYALAQTTFATSVLLVSGSVSGGHLVPLTGITEKSVDNSVELSNLAFEISWSDVNRSASDGDVIAEVYGVGVELQRTRDLKQ